MILIYTLVDPVTFEVRYVGQTSSSLKKRLKDHCHCKARRHVVNWIASLSPMGIRPLIVEVGTAATRDEADALEKYYIAYYRSLGYALTNHEGGGVGSNRIVSDETRAKMSASKKGKPINEETKAKLSAAQKGCPRLTPEQREWWRQLNLGKKLSPESIAKRVQKQRGQKRSEEFKKRLSVINRGKPPSLLARQRASERQSKTYVVVSPDGAQAVVHNLTNFCRLNGLSRTALGNVVSGRSRTHRGWTCRLADAEDLMRDTL